MKTAAYALAILMLAGGGPARAYDLEECDNDSTFGDSAILLGWALPTSSSIGAITIDDQGAIRSGISGATAIAEWQSAMADWGDTTSQAFTFPTTIQTTVTGAQVAASLASSTAGSAKYFFVVQTNTAAGSTSGWSGFTGTDPCTVLGVTIFNFDTTSRRLVDADILMNDDDQCTSTPLFFSVGATPGAYDFRTVAAHEIGHFLGGAHSVNSSSLMFPIIAANTAIGVQPDDEGILQFLYPTLPSPVAPDRNNPALTVCVTSNPTAGGGFPNPNNLTYEQLTGGEGWCSADPTGQTHGIYPFLLVTMLALMKLAYRRVRRPAGALARVRSASPRV